MSATVQNYLTQIALEVYAAGAFSKRDAATVVPARVNAAVKKIVPNTHRLAVRCAVKSLLKSI